MRKKAINYYLVNNETNKTKNKHMNIFIVRISNVDLKITEKRIAACRYFQEDLRS